MNVLRRSLLAFAIGLTGASALQSLDYAEAFDNASRLTAAPLDLNLGDCLRGGARKTWGPAYRAICGELAPEKHLADRPGCTIDEKGTTRIVRAGRERVSPPRIVAQSSGIALLVTPACMVKSPASGKVLFAGDFKGYRGVVILSLAAGRRLIVAGLGALGVRRDQEIERGAALGVTSAIGAPALASAFRENAASRSLLYFDLRNAEGAGEPIFWLAAAH